MSFTPQRIVGLVLAGGQSRRFGADKARALLVGMTLSSRVADILRRDADEIAVAGDADIAASLNAEHLHDPPGVARGPLAGVLAGLHWAQRENAAWLVTAPCDAPLLPADMAMRLIAEAEAADVSAAHAETDDGMHALCAVWRPGLAADLALALRGGAHPPAHEFAADMQAARVRFADRAAFLNVNTPDDLKRAEAVLNGRP